MTVRIETLDLVIIIVYLLGIVGLGCWVGIRRHKGEGTGKDYFLAGGTLTWPIIGLALFSTNISTIHLVSLAQEGYVNGLAYGNFEWMAPFTLIILALFFAPFYVRSRVATLPDFLEKRYNRQCRDWLAILSIVSAIFLHIGFSLFTGAEVLHGMFGIDRFLSIVLIAAMTGLYTMVGGLMAVVVTESIQTVVLLLGAICIEDRDAHIEEGVLYVDGKAAKNTLDTYGFMIRELLPVGLRGIVAAALLAALMGTVSGALNSVATLFSYDLFKRWKPDIDDHRLVVIGRIVTFFGMIAAIIWSPFLGRFDSVFQGINSMICYIAPPITAVFLWGVLWRRASARAAQITLYSGSALGLTVFLLDWYKEVTGWGVLFMMSAFYLFAACSIILVIASFVWPHEHTTESDALVWSNPLAALQGEAWPGLGNYKLLAFLLFIVMLALYWVFA